MRYSPVSLSKVCSIALGAFILDVAAAQTLTPDALNNKDAVITEIERDISAIDESARPAENLPELPAAEQPARMSKEQTLAYLQEHVEEFEQLLIQLLYSGQNIEALQDLIPLYEKQANFDPSIIDWGNAILLGHEGKKQESIALYRKLNAALPDIYMLHFQLAVALYKAEQFNAAKKEFETLRATASGEAEKAVVEQFLSLIARKQKWDFGVGANYLHDPNITNAPPVGTVIKNGDSELRYNTPHEKGSGVSFDLSASRKWFNDNRLFVGVDLRGYGDIYLNNQKHSDTTLSFGLPFGYQSGSFELEFQPYLNKRFYAGGTAVKTPEFGDYATSFGLKTSASYWLSNRWRAQGLMRMSQTQHKEAFAHNDSKDFFTAATLAYLPNSSQYFSLGGNYSFKQANSLSNSFDRYGVSASWSQVWPKGFSTRLSLSYAQRQYRGQNFAAIQKLNDEYSVSLSLWNREWQILGVTPRLNWQFNQVKSNFLFDEYDKHTINLEFTKSF